MGSGLSGKKELIVLISSIIQSIALTAGLTIAINEFIVNDARIKRETVRNTLEITDVSKNLFLAHNKMQQLYFGDQTYTIDENDKEKREIFDKQVLAIRSVFEPFFQRINILGSNRIIDTEMTCRLLFNYADVYFSFVENNQPFSTLLDDEVGYKLLSTYEFCKNCVNNNFYMGSDEELAKAHYAEIPQGTAFGRP